MSYDIVAVTRHCPENHATVVLVAHTAFSKPPDGVVPTTQNKYIQTTEIKPLHVEGSVLLNHHVQSIRHSFVTDNSYTPQTAFFESYFSFFICIYVDYFRLLLNIFIN